MRGKDGMETVNMKEILHPSSSFPFVLFVFPFIPLSFRKVPEARVRRSDREETSHTLLHSIASPLFLSPILWMLLLGET